MARKVDDLGRIVLPVELRRLHSIHTGDALEISVDGDAIVLRKLETACVFCGGRQELTEFKGRAVCSACFSELSQPAPRHAGDGARVDGSSATTTPAPAQPVGV